MEEENKSSVYKVFKNYYLPNILIFGVLFIILYYFTDLIETIKINGHTTLFIFAILLISFLIGTWRLFEKEYFKPWYFKRKIKRKPLKTFLNSNFELDEDGQSYSGKIDDYYLSVGYNWENTLNRSILYFTIYFDAKPNNKFIAEKQYDEISKKLKKSKNYIVLNGLVRENHLNSVFTFIAHHELMEQIKEAIIFLKANNLEPISFENWNYQLKEVEAYSKGLSSFDYNDYSLFKL
jgi:hypothetical protein